MNTDRRVVNRNDLKDTFVLVSDKIVTGVFNDIHAKLKTVPSDLGNYYGLYAKDLKKIEEKWGYKRA